MTCILNNCLNHWRSHGNKGRKENFDVVLEVDGLDIYLNKDVNSPRITLRIEDKSVNYEEYKSNYIQKICGKRFKYYSPKKFVYTKCVEDNQVTLILELVDMCKNDFLVFRAQFYKQKPKLDLDKNKSCNKTIESLSSLQKEKKFFLEISHSEYLSLFDESPPSNFKPFMLCGKVLDEDTIFVDLYLIVDSKSLSWVRSSDMLFTSLSELIKDSSEVVNNFTLNLE
jgi:hypothetical protein